VNLHDLFAIGRGRDPDKAALLWSEDDPALAVAPPRLSFRQLHAASDRLAAALAERGLERGDRVAFFLGNRPEMVAAVLAVLRLGAVVVPMNLAYRRREISHILADAMPRLLLTETARREVLAEVEEGGGLGSVEAILEIEPLWGGSPQAAAPRPNVDGSDLALLLYTSGTTGRSKGAMISHDNVLATVSGLLAAWAWEPHDVLLLTLPLFHTHGLVVGLFCALAAGATVRLHRRFDAERVWGELRSGAAGDPEAAAPSLFFGVPTMYQRLLAVAAAQAQGEPPGQADLSHLRLLCSGSAPLPAELFDGFRRLTAQTILERYGMTETGMNLSNPYAGRRLAGTVGTPLPGVSARITGAGDEDAADVDATCRPLPDGEEGELQVRGSHVFAGYWRDEEKTRASFVADAAGRSWFRTGDLARRDPDTGHVTLLGRSHELILRGGYNVYPREIEEVLCAHPAVQEAAVVGQADAEWGEVPVAWLVLGAEAGVWDAAEPAAAELATLLAEHCRRHIAAFKVPAAFHVVDALPRNALGKVQKHRLGRVESEASQA